MVLLQAVKGLLPSASQSIMQISFFTQGRACCLAHTLSFVSALTSSVLVHCILIYAYFIFLQGRENNQVPSPLKMVSAGKYSQSMGWSGSFLEATVVFVCLACLNNSAHKPLKCIRWSANFIFRHWVWMCLAFYDQNSPSCDIVFPNELLQVGSIT